MIEDAIQEALNAFAEENVYLKRLSLPKDAYLGFSAEIIKKFPNLLSTDMDKEIKYAGPFGYVTITSERQ